MALLSVRARWRHHGTPLDADPQFNLLAAATPQYAMTVDEVIAIVRSANIAFELGTRQFQFSQVRFFHKQTNRSLNLGYRGQTGRFVADFVFKGESKEINDTKCIAFFTSLWRRAR
jgi:hypothetical protein